MNVHTALKAGKEGFTFTVISIIGTLAIGYFLGKQFESEIENYLGYIIIGFIVVTTVPLIIAFLRRNIGLKINKDNIENINDW